MAPISAAMPTSIVQSITARTGFAVDQIKVVGNRETSEIDILDRLELDGWTSLIGFDAEAARERIGTLPWVEVAAVRKVYPHTLEVRVEEREPFALWQQGTELSVIERSGAVIAPFSGGKQALLPLIIGTGAPAQGARLPGQDRDVSRARGAGQRLYPHRRTALGPEAGKRHHRQASRGWRGPGDRRAGQDGS